jgi:hypothetical protein
MKRKMRSAIDLDAAGLHAQHEHSITNSSFLIGHYLCVWYARARTGNVCKFGTAGAVDMPAAAAAAAGSADDVNDSAVVDDDDAVPSRAWAISCTNCTKFVRDLGFYMVPVGATCSKSMQPLPLRSTMLIMFSITAREEGRPCQSVVTV